MTPSISIPPLQYMYSVSIELYGHALATHAFWACLSSNFKKVKKRASSARVFRTPPPPPTSLCVRHILLGKTMGATPSCVHLHPCPSSAQIFSGPLGRGKFSKLLLDYRSFSKFKFWKLHTKSEFFFILRQFYQNFNSFHYFSNWEKFS